MMRKIQIAVIALMIPAVVSPLWAQAATAAPQPPAESVLKQIPAGTMGYVVVNNIEKTARNVEKFMTTVGLMPPPQLAVDRPQPSMLIAKIRQEAKLGKGFNPNAGAAIAVLDPRQFGINLPAVLASEMTGAELDEKNAAAMKAGFPFVLFVPGSSLSKTFGNYEIVAKDDGFATIKLRMGTMHAGRTGSYIVLSPNEAAIKAVLVAKKKASDELTKADAALIARNEIAYRIDYKPLTPIFTELFAVFGKEIAAHEQDMGPIMNLYFSFISEMLKQFETEVGGVRIDKTGIVAESLTVAKADSTMGKLWAAQAKVTHKGGAAVLDSLASLPYVLAFGAAGAPGGGEAAGFVTKLIDDVLALEPLATKLDAATKAKTKKVVAGLMDQIGEVQFVGGAAPAGNGMFGIAWVIKCKDSAKLTALLADKAALAQTFITTLIDEPDAKQLKITYSKGVDKAGEIPVDAVEISHPEMLKMSARERKEMMKALGEDKIRFLIAAPDKQTVVVTFGGSTAMTSKAIAASSSKGPIPIAPGTKEVMQYMPKDPDVLFLLNPANLLDVIRSGITAAIEDPEQRQNVLKVIPQLQCKTPIAVGAKMQDNAGHAVLYIPTALVKEIIPKIQQAMMMWMMQDGPEPPEGVAPDGPPPGDF